jgi:hypothetical protein
MPLASPTCRNVPEEEFTDGVSMESYVPTLQPLTVLRTIIPTEKSTIVKPPSSVHVTF